MKLAGMTSITVCQGSRYNPACPGGSRECQEYKGLWLCLKKCYKKRVVIAKVAGRSKA